MTQELLIGFELLGHGRELGAEKQEKTKKMEEFTAIVCFRSLRGLLGSAMLSCKLLCHGHDIMN